MKKNPNYDNTVGKHPIPHAQGIAKGEVSQIEKSQKDANNKKAHKEEE